MNPAPPVTTARTAVSYEPPRLRSPARVSTAAASRPRPSSSAESLTADGVGASSRRASRAARRSERRSATSSSTATTSRRGPETALYLAARAQHVDQVIRPALARGATVVCDRYLDTSVAYQGAGRELGVEAVLELNLLAVGGLLPDRTFLVEIDVETALARVGDKRDRIEQAEAEFWPRVVDAYRDLAARYPERYVVVDGRRPGRGGRRERYVSAFADVPEQPEAKRLLDAALADGPAHAYLFHGPPAVGKRTAAQALAGALLGDARRVDAGTHPDLRVIEALGDMIRIDEIRALHHDLHMRPFEGDRRVYLILDAHRMNDEAAAALLKDLEEPPAYATLVLVADELGLAPRDDPLAVPARPVPAAVAQRRRGVARRPRAELEPRTRPRRSRASPAAASTALRGCSTTPRAPSAPPAHARARARTSRRSSIRATRRPSCSRRPARASGRRASRSRSVVDGLDLPTREAEQRVRRAGFGAEQDEILASLDDLAAWYRDLVLVGAGAEAAVVNADRLDDLRADVEGGAGRRGGRRAARASGLARGGGVQPQRDAAPRGAVRPPAARVQRVPSAAR